MNILYCAYSTRNYVWDYADQLVCYYNQAAVSPTIFTQFDYAGQDRVSKLVRTGTAASPVYERTIYIDGIFEYSILETSTTTYEKNYIHIMDDQSRIAELRINAGTAFPGDIADDVVYNLEDQIGSSSVRLGLNGTIIDKEEYYPFGDSSLRTFAYKRYRYVGKERDAESGLYYYGARYYSAWICKFVGVDPLAKNYPFYGPYDYAGNKPVNKIDIDGMQEEGKEPFVASTQTEAIDADGNVVSTYSQIQVELTDSGYTIHHCEEITYYKNTDQIATFTKSEILQGNNNYTPPKVEELLRIYFTEKTKSTSETSTNLKALGTSNDIIDGVGKGFKNLGKTRIGNNGSIYFETPRGNVFYGNQYVRTFSLLEVGSKIGKVMGH